MIERRCSSLIGLLSACLLLLNACGGAGGGERQTVGIPVPPTTSIVATLTSGTAVPNTVVGTDEETFYTFTATAGDFFSLQLFAARAMQSDWVTKAPILRIYRPGSDPTLMDLYLEHDYNAFNWYWGMQDLDIPLFRIPTGGTGTWYLSISNTRTAVLTPHYILRLQPAGPFVTDSSNNTTSANASLISPGLTVDSHTAGISNFFKIQTSVDTIACFEVTAYRNGMFKGSTEYFDPTLILRNSSGTTLAQETGNLNLDDYYFADPALCYKVITPGTYFLEVKETINSDTDSDFFLSYTSRTYPVGGGGESEGSGVGSVPNNTSGAAEPLPFDAVFTGNIGTAVSTDNEDWFKFDVTPGDLLHLQVFDHDNAADSTGKINIEFKDAGLNPVAVSGPVLVSASRYATSNGAFTLRTMLPGSTPATGYVRITPAAGNSASTNYTLELTRFMPATYTVGSTLTSDFTMEQDNVSNDFATGAELLDSNDYAAGDMDYAGDRDFFQFVANSSALVNINVYAKDSTSAQVHDLSGLGSNLDPLVNIYANLTDATNRANPISKATYAGIAAAAGITAPIPTLSLSFIAPATGTYYLSIEKATDPASFSNTRYFIEVIK